MSSASRAVGFWAPVAVAAVVVAGLAAGLGTGGVAVADAPGVGPTGVGDPYLPLAGGPGYDVSSYALDARVDPAAGRIEASTVVAGRATSRLSTVHLDLALPATAVRVDGSDVAFSQHGGDLAVRLPHTLAPGQAWEATVTYAGIVDAGDQGAVYRDGDDLVIAGEPASCAAWYPCNDHPRDPATFSAMIRVPSGVEAVSGGRLVSHGPDPSSPGEDLWVWSADEPSVTYASVLAVGQYDVRTSQATVLGRPVQYVAAVSTRRDVEADHRWLAGSVAAAERLASRFGPYPFSSIGGIVVPVDLEWGALETQGRPIYHPRLAGSSEVLVHELAHFWFGDSVTLYQWRDIFLNEAFASYAAWIEDEERGGPPASARFAELYSKAPDAFWTQKLSDPGQGRALFTRVYDRGPMTLHALRTRMGDDAFFSLLREWASRRGPATLDEFRALARERSPVDVTGLLDAWLDSTTKVPARADFGFA